MPVVAIAMIACLSAFTGEGESSGHSHASCINGSTKACKTRDCTTTGCKLKVNECSDAGWLDSKTCKK